MLLAVEIATTEFIDGCKKCAWNMKCDMTNVHVRDHLGNAPLMSYINQWQCNPVA